MNHKKNILDELNHVAPALIPLRGKNVFRVPEQYFDVFPRQVIDQISHEPLLNKPVYRVPEGYFEGLAGKVMDKIQEEAASAGKAKDLWELAGRKNPFSLPEGYFEQLPQAIVRRVAPAKVVPIRRRIYRIAVAAMVAAVVLLGIVYYLQPNSPEVPAVARYDSPEKLETGLSQLTDEEIVNYLENYGNILDNSALIRDTEEGLPRVTDYFLDDETLENYLNDIEG